MKRLTIIFALVLAATSMMADQFKIGKLTFEVDRYPRNTVKLIKANKNISKAHLSETITYKGETYTLTSIGDKAFRNCKSLTSITIPNSVTEIGSNAFLNCKSFTSITIPNSVTSIGANAFYGTALYNDSANWENGALYINDCLIEVNIKVSGEYIIRENTRLINNFAFFGCKRLTGITIPNSVTNIGYAAFEGCSSLTSVTIPNSVTEIGWDTFDGCKSLKSVTIPNSVTNIGYAAFGGCSSLTSVTIPNSVTEIESFAFLGCKSLTSVTIPSSVKKIGYRTFENTALYNDPANWENGVLYIGDCLIQVDKNFVGNCNIKANTRLIAKQAFAGCAFLTSVTIPSSVTKIDYNTFSDCTSLTSITIPSSVTEVEYNAFEGCKSLKELTIPKSVKHLTTYAFPKHTKIIRK